MGVEKPTAAKRHPHTEADSRYPHAAGIVLPDRGDGLHWLRCDECGREWAEKDSGAFAKGSKVCGVR